MKHNFVIFVNYCRRLELLNEQYKALIRPLVSVVPFSRKNSSYTVHACEDLSDDILFNTYCDYTTSVQHFTCKCVMDTIPSYVSLYLYMYMYYVLSESQLVRK